MFNMFISFRIEKYVGKFTKKGSFCYEHLIQNGLWKLSQFTLFPTDYCFGACLEGVGEVHPPVLFLNTDSDSGTN